MPEQRKWLILATVLLLVGIAALLTADPALAHTRVEIGPYAVVVGWWDEPPLVGERNAIVLEITEREGGAAVPGAEATLSAEVLYGGRTFRTNLNPTVEPGTYTADIIPTVRGQYAVRLFGTIGDLAVDEVIEPEEVFPASRLEFPEAQPETRQLQQELVSLEGQLRTMRLIAIAGIGIGLIALSLAALSWLRQRR